MNFVKNIYKCVTDVEFAKQFLTMRLPDQVAQTLRLTARLDRGIEFTKENIDSIVNILIDLLPSLLIGESLHFGRKLLLVKNLAQIFKVDFKMLERILGLHRNQMAGAATIEAQGIVFSNTWLALICTLVMGTIPNPILVRKLTELLRFYDLFDKVTSKQNILEGVINKLPETVQNLFLIKDLNIEDQINDKIKEINGFINIHRERKTTFYNTNEVRSFKTYRAWLEEQINCLGTDNNAPRNLLTVLSKLKNELVDIKGTFIDEDFNPHPIEPFCIYLTGPPGVGKSSIAKYIAAAINNQAEKVHQSNLIYVKNPGDPYCTGYTGQFCWIYDDFAQKINSDDGLELIKYITPQRAPLNMASMSDPTIGIKGTKQQSLLFICCSNVSHPIFNNLEDQGAFLRRRHVVIDMSNPMKDDPLNATFRYVDRFENKVISNAMNFKQLLLDVISKYNKHMGCQDILRARYINTMTNFGPHSLDVINGRISLSNREEIVSQGFETEAYIESQMGTNTYNRVQRQLDEVLSHVEDPNVLQVYNRLLRRNEFLDAREEDNTEVSAQDLQIALLENKTYWQRLKAYVCERLKAIFGALKHYIVNIELKDALMISAFAIAFSTKYLAYRKPAQQDIEVEGSSGHKNKEARHKQWLDQRHARELLNRNVRIGTSSFYDDYMEGTHNEDNYYVPEGHIDNLDDIVNTVKQDDQLSLAIYTNGCRNKFDLLARKLKNNKVVKTSANKTIYQTKIGNVILDNNVKEYVSQLNNKKDDAKTLISEGCEDQEAVNVTKLVASQMLSITTICEEDGTVVRSMTMSALPIKGNLIMAPRHLFMYKGDYMTGRVIISNKNVSLPELEFDVNNIVEFPDADYGSCDIVLYNTGARMRTFRDITNLFCTRKTLAQLSSRFEMCLVKQHEGEIINYFTRDTDMITNDTMYDASGCKIVLGKVLQYALSTEKGDCGSVAILYHASSAGKILGMHIAGAKAISKGFSKPISRELIIERVAFAEKKYGPQVNGMGIERLRNVIISAEGKDVDIDLPIIGLLEKNSFMATKTKYVKSDIFESCGPHRCEPAILDPYDERNVYSVSPLFKAVNKYAETNKFIPKKYLDKIRTALPVLFRREIQTQLKLFSMEELINGTQEKYIDPINMKSSPGWPYPRSKDGKRHLFEINTSNKYVPGKELSDRLYRRRELGEKGIRIESLWTDCLKDETRELAKIDEVKTRSFCVAPVDFNIWLRHFTMDFRRRICENRISNGVSIGINPYSLEWTMLANHMTEYSDTGYAGDYSGFDRLLHSELMDMCLQFIFDNLPNQSESDLMFFRTLVSEIKFANCVVGKYVYHRNRGLPSGADLTATLNSMVGICYLFYAWLYNAPNKYQNVVAFINNVKYQVYGDDNMFFPRDSVKSFYNFATVQRALLAIGITYTPETKQASTTNEARYIHEMSFLSNGFRPENGFYKATLKKISIIEMTNWISKKLPSHQATKDNVNTALRFLYFYGFPTYNLFYNKWKQYAEYTYDALDEIYIENGGFDDILEFDNEIESQGNTINHIQNMQGWSHVTKASLPSEITGDKLDNKFKVSTMDKPIVSVACPPTVLKDFQGLSNSCNLEFMNKLTLNPGSQQITSSDNTSEDTDEMSLLEIGRRWGFLRGVFEVTTWTKDYVIIDDYSMEPCYALTSASETARNVSPMCVASMYNSFWRGSLEYKFIFFTDGFTTGKVCVDFRYGCYGKFVGPTKTSERNSQYSVIMDVSPHKYIFHVRVPYMHAAPWLCCRNANRKYEEISGNYTGCVSLGIMHITVVNPFVGSGNDRAKVRLNILERMGPDMELAGSFSNNLTVITEGKEDIIGNTSSMLMKMGETADSKGTTIDTIGSTNVINPTKFNGNQLLSMDSNNITFDYFFNRWQQIGSSEIISASSPNVSYDIYKLLWTRAQWAQILSQYVYFRCARAKIRVEVNGNAFCSGGLMVAHVPVTADTTKISAITDHNVVNMQHGLLNFNTTSSVTLDAPYINDTDFTSLVYQENGTTVTSGLGKIDQIRPLGTLLLNYTFAALQKIGETPQSPSVVIYMKIEDIVLKIPVSLQAITDKASEEIESQGSEGTYMTNLDSEIIVIGELMPLSKDYAINDPVTSLRDLIKKYVPFQLIKKSENGANLYIGSLGSVAVRLPSLVTSSSSGGAYAANGFLRLAKQMFALYRGGLRYKIRATTVNSETELDSTVGTTSMAVYNASMKEKHPVTMYAAFSPRPDASEADSMYVYADYFVMPNNFSYTSTATYDMTSTSGYLEFEIPFGINSVWKTHPNPNSSNDNNNPLICDAVTYVFFKNENRSDIKVNIVSLTAGADDLRFKSFTGVNKIRVLLTGQEPDAYAP